MMDCDMRPGRICDARRIPHRFYMTATFDTFTRAMSVKLSVRDLQKSYGQLHAVRGVSFEVREGEIFGLLGPNGAGKTSTIECVIGLREVDSGSIQVCGFDDLRQPKEIKQRIGVQLQSTSLQDKIRVREALKLFASFYRSAGDIDDL